MDIFIYMYKGHKLLLALWKLLYLQSVSPVERNELSDQRSLKLKSILKTVFFFTFVDKDKF